ncbi:MAG TPA: ATP-binding cassette domain-containing protein [Acetobacteraceae bacterium]|nr:ATP-binding cassette domain-containing protein [Acetobacteraceae bacterium]
MPPILHARDIHFTHGGQHLLAGAELAVAPGERLCLVGRNGSGKSTLLRICAGLLPAQEGELFLQPGTTIRYLPQEPDFAGAPTTLAYVERGLGPADDPHRAVAALRDLGLTGEENPATLSGGEARRAAIARVLAPAPDLLLLDEPTNHLDLPAIEWLEAALTLYRGALVLISHDRRLLERIGRAVIWLDRGRTLRAERGFAEFKTWRDEVLAQEEHAQHKLARQIVREEHWMRYGVTARRKRNVRRVAELAALRDAKRTFVRALGNVTLAAAEAQGSGKLVATAENIGKSFGGRCVVRDFSTRILRGDRLGIVGPNGAGKTTLLRLLTGTLAADTGEVRLGTNLAIVSLDQTRASLDPARTLAETLTGGGGDTVNVHGEKRHVIGYMKDFLFRPEQAKTPVGVLSGGERGRLMLAVALAKPSNLMILDEPTNDLDLETLDLLEDMLADYKGTVILVSHDRDFLDRVVTSTIAAEGDGTWVEYAGGYSDMLRQRGEPAAPQPRQAAKAGAAKSPPAPPTRPQTRGLSFKDQHALKTLPAEIARLEAEIARHQAVLADATLYERDAKTFRAVTASLGRDSAALAAAEERWLTLELQRETTQVQKTR